MHSPMAQAVSVSPTAAHSADPAAWCHSAATVLVIEGNSSGLSTPDALSPCHRPSAAPSTMTGPAGLGARPARAWSPRGRGVSRTRDATAPGARIGWLARGRPEHARRRDRLLEQPECLDVRLHLAGAAQ